MALSYTAPHERRFPKVEYSLTRRKFITSTTVSAAAVAGAGKFATSAQDKPTIGVGSMMFTESIILAELLAQLAEHHGYSADRQLNLGGTLVAHEALLNGDIDTYAEYTGTALAAILGLELPEVEESDEATPASGGSRADLTYDMVNEAYMEDYGLEWLDPFGFNNTYVLTMRREHAEELGVEKISDLEPYAADLSIGSDAEGNVREDGIPGIQTAYGIEFKDAVTLDVGLMYPAVRDGEVDVITAYSTDGRIEAMDLFMLEDDLDFFPPYYAAPVVRIDTMEESPEVRDALNMLAGKIDNTKMMEMNYLADGEGMEPAAIARDFLVEVGVIEDE